MRADAWMLWLCSLKQWLACGVQLAKNHSEYKIFACVNFVYATGIFELSKEVMA